MESIVVCYQDVYTATFLPISQFSTDPKTKMRNRVPTFGSLLKNLTTISGLNALNSDQTRSGVPKPEKFVSYRNTKRSGLYRRQIKDATWARIEPSTYDLLAQLTI